VFDENSNTKAQMAFSGSTDEPTPLDCRTVKDTLEGPISGTPPLEDAPGQVFALFDIACGTIDSIIGSG
jgi:hypothetical protein